MRCNSDLLPLHRQPVFWLLVASGLVALSLWEGDHFAPERDTDSVSYEHAVLPAHGEHDADLRGQPLLLALASSRTLAYPIFLDLVRPLTPDLGWLPRIQWFLFTLAMLYFWYATTVFSGSRWFAFSVTVPLAFPCWITDISFVLPVALAVTLALAAIASLLLLARRPTSRLAWTGLAVATLLAYHTKPVFQFLVVLLPVLAAILRLSIERRPRHLGRWCLGLVAATALPLLLFCALRLAVVGHFGLVSFNGYNMVGIAANFLDYELVASLPEEHRRLAKRILDNRHRRGDSPYSPGRPMHQWRRQYVRNQWSIAEPAARQIVAEEISSGLTPEAKLEPINLVIDRKLAALSTAVLRKKPRHYFNWVFSGLGYGLGRTLDCRPVRWLTVALLFTLAVAWPVCMLRRRMGAARASPGETTGAASGVAVFAIALTAVSLYVVNVAVIVLVSWPQDPYLAPARLLLPSALAGAVFALWAHALRGLGAGVWQNVRRWGPAAARFEVAALAVLALGLGGWSLADHLFPLARADRIWVDPASAPPGQPVSFFAIRDLKLPSKASSARLLIQAEEEYRLIVNRVVVGSNRWVRDDQLDTYEVGDLLTKRRNSLFVELRSVDGEGGFLCRLDVSLVGQKRRTVFSDTDWWIVRRFRAGILRARRPLDDPEVPVVVSPSRRWGLRAGPRRPRFDEILSTPATIAARRFRTGLQEGWQEFEPAAGSPGTPVTFDWGNEVTGYLNLKFDEIPAALVYTGLEPPNPRIDRGQALIQTLSRNQTWTDTSPRRFRYVTVVSTVQVAGAWIDAVAPEWAERLNAEGKRPGPDAPSSPSLEELWRQLAARRSRPDRG